MDYYEELGLSRSASTEEIRSAYRTLVRVLHPDGQSEDAARLAAEQQLKRLNGMMEVLLHSERRRRYDFSLELDARPSPPPPRYYPPIIDPPFLPGAIPLYPAIAIFAAGALLGCVAMYLSLANRVPVASNAYASEAYGTAPQRSSAIPSPPLFPPRPADHTVTERYHEALDRVATLPTQVDRIAIPPLHAANGVTPRQELSASVNPSSPAPVPLVDAPPTLAPSAMQPDLPVGLPIDSPVKPGAPGVAIAGRWLYSPDRNRPNTRLYAPQFIELVSKLDGNFISGSFRSRYYVQNQSFSPDVDFEFRGPLTNAGSSAYWVSSDGSRGTVNMRLLPSGSLQVDWVRTRAGTERKLAFGKAVLSRENP